MKSTWLLALTVACALMLGWSAFSDELEVGVQVGQRAPDFTLPLLDGEVETTNLYEEVAKYDVTLLYFFYAAQ